KDSPFAGLKIPPDLRVYAQVLAQPGPALAGKVIASLQDGTPLVTRSQLGLGHIVLVHVTANAEWSNLPLSGLFPKMLQRLARSDNLRVDKKALAGQNWTPIKILDGFGLLSTTQSLVGVEGSVIEEGRFNAKMPPGIYQSGVRFISRNLAIKADALVAMEWPVEVVVNQPSVAEMDLAGFFLSLAVFAVLVDIVASLWISGRLPTSAALCLALFFIHPVTPVNAQSNLSPEIALTQEMVLGYILSGEQAVDQIAAEGLSGLSSVMGERTSVEPGKPVGIFLEKDELAFFPLIYWPVSALQPVPSQQAYKKLNIYLNTGGVILFDTRDGDLGGAGRQGQVNRALRKLTEPLDIPRLEVVPDDHVLTRSFYLLQDFPGRYRDGQLWVKASKIQSTSNERMPFRILNDGVTPVLIGGNDWAAAWALDENGVAKYPVGRGYAGDRQREKAFRFGVNLIMHVLTGNYKSDQVHVPALLERLGQ
ncbi:MAG: LytTR family transcriptional regulator, partial [Aestuariivita sp.]|nr:LytTR family transcriptional regulator [Aestuariivita sp.]